MASASRGAVMRERQAPHLADVFLLVVAAQIAIYAALETLPCGYGTRQPNIYYL